MIVFMTNYLNIHLLPFTNKMYEILGDQFRFISMSPITQTRIKMGFDELDSRYSYVLKAYESKEALEQAREIAAECDALIVGSVEDHEWAQRARQGKLTIKCSERFFKTGINIHNFISALRHLTRYQNCKNLYFLCSSAYTAADVNRFSNYRGRTFKWGYFPKVVHQNMDALLECRNAQDKISVLWAGRFVDWKHPEKAVMLAEHFRSRGIRFEMNLIGDGDLREVLEKSIETKKLTDCVHIKGFQKPDVVRQYMEKADIFLFTSDRNEGWGAVLNEAMNSGCAVVASHAIGSVPYMVKNGENGLIYQNDSIESLYDRADFLVEHPEERMKISRSAYETVANEWNGDMAAQRLVMLIQSLLDSRGGEVFQNGICSHADILEDNWFQDKKDGRQWENM